MIGALVATVPEHDGDEPRFDEHIHAWRRAQCAAWLAAQVWGK